MSDIVGQLKCMPKKKPHADDRVTVRLGKLHGKLARIASKSGQKDSEIVRTALTSFLNANPTADDVIKAIMESRAKEAD